MSVKDWSPGLPAGGRKRGEVKIRILGNLGDANPLDYGGLIVYEMLDRGKKYIDAEYWTEPGPESETYTVYAWGVEKNVQEDLVWVDWEAVASYTGHSLDQLKELGRSRDPMDRASVYKAVGDYYGYDEFDSYPLELTREDMEKRWPEFAR